MTDQLKTLALAVRNTPWQPMAGMPPNILNDAGLRVARCDFDGDFAHSDAHTNAAYIVAASPDAILKLIAERDALKQELEAARGQVGAAKESATLWNKRYQDVCQARISLRQKYGHAIEVLEAEIEQHSQHQKSGECWSHPTLDYKDPETGAEIWIRNKPK
jgi:outer membrane murein-binding lipoprotein Lpp